MTANFIAKDNEKKADTEDNERFSITGDFACKILSLSQFEYNRSIREALNTLFREYKTHYQLNDENVV